MKKLPWKLVLLILLVGINGILLIFQFWPEGTRPQGMMRFVWVFLLAACYGLILFLLHRLHDRYGKYFPAVTGQGRAVLSFLDRCRWPAGIFVWTLLTVFQIHGSSIGMYSFYLGEPQTSADLIGFSRPSHFDEWLNMTTFALAQYANGFSQFNPAFSAVPTDMGLFPGSPVEDWSTIFRPFLLGYLFLPPGMGLAFYWTGRLILLFLVSFEFGKILTDGKKTYAVLYAWMVTLSPAVQWWFGVNGLAEMLMAGQAGVLVLHRYIAVRGKKERIGLATAAAYLACVYGMTLYPAWQIPFGYAFLLMALLPLMRTEGRRPADRTDLFCGGLFLLMTGAAAVHLWTLSGPSIEAIRQTVYPGHRFVTGGGLTVKELFTGPLALFMPFAEFITPALNFNMVSFWDLAPLGWIMAAGGVIRTKRIDPLTAGLMALQGVFLLFCFFPWPSWLVKITLLYAVPVGRMTIPLSFINLIILVRVISFYPAPWGKKASFPVALACTVLALRAVFAYCPDAYSLRNGIVLAAAAGAGFLVFLRYRRYMGPYAMGLFLVIGGMVNPVARGVSSVYDTALAGEIKEAVAEDPSGRWIVSAPYNFLNNYPAVFGASVVNTFTVHPAWTVWNSLPLTEEDRTALNRCAHINIKEITGGETKFSVSSPDNIVITLNRDDVMKLGIRHILTKDENLEALDTDGVRFVPRSRAGAWIIYEVRRTGA